MFIWFSPAKIVTENAFQHAKQLAHRVGLAGIVDHLAVAAGLDQIDGPQFSEVLRQSGLAELDLFSDGPDRHLTVDQMVHDQQPLLIAHECQKRGSRLGIGD
jgi:hypothetical protein